MKHHLPSIVLFLLSVVFGTLTVLSFSGCAPSVNTVRQSFTTAAKLLDSSARAFENYDFAHQEELVMQAFGKADAGRLVADYRRQRIIIVRSFSAAGATLAAGMALLPLVEAGKEAMAALLARAAEVFAAIKSLNDAIEELKATKAGKVPVSIRKKRKREKIQTMLALDDVPPICEHEPCREITLPEEVPSWA